MSKLKPLSKEYKGQQIEIRVTDKKESLLINNKPIKYGQLPGGSYFIEEYAYDWKDNLEDLAKAFIDYQDNVKKIRNKKGIDQGEK